MKDWTARIVGAVMAALIGAVVVFASVKPNENYSKDKRWIEYVLLKTTERLDSIDAKLGEIKDRLPKE